MHDLPTMYALCSDVIAAQANDLFDERGNTRDYPHLPKLSDREVIGLAVSAEALGVDSELQLFAHLRDYPGLLPHRGSRQRFNARRRGLVGVIDRCLRAVSEALDLDGEHVVVDSMPIPTASVKREGRSRACRRPELDAYCADKVYHASSGQYLLGYKLHLTVTTSGVYAEHVVRPASHHDARVLAELTEAHAGGTLPEEIARRYRGRHVLADKGYDARQLRLDFAEHFSATLAAVTRVNRGNWAPYDPYLARMRRYVETVFSQLCDEVAMKVNRAKRFAGLNARVSTKLLTRTVKQWVNYHTGRPLNQTKDWLAGLS